MAKVYVQGKGWIDEELARQVAMEQADQLAQSAAAYTQTPAPTLASLVTPPVQPQMDVESKNAKLQDILQGTGTTGSWSMGNEGRPKLQMQGSPRTGSGLTYEQALNKQWLSDQDQLYRQKQNRALMEILNDAGTDPVRRDQAFKMLQALERQPALGAPRGSTPEERLQEAQILKTQAETEKARRGEVPKAEWGTVESGGKVYQVNKNTGEIRPAEVGGEQLVGKEGKKLDPVAKREGALAALTTAGYNPETGQDQVEALIKQSTSGGLQKGGAAAARFFDVTTKGGEAIQALKTISDSITLDLLNGKLGAGISNADVKFLQGTLGDVANEDLTATERLAAWKQARSRIESFAEINKGKPATKGVSEVGQPQTGQVRYKLRAPGLDPKLKSSYEAY